MPHLCLIVDRDARAVGNMQRVFPSFGLRGYRVSSFEAAQEIVRHWKFDSIVLNDAILRPPPMKSLSELQPLIATPLLVRTNFPEEKQRIAHLRNGAADVICIKASAKLVAAKLFKLIEIRMGLTRELRNDLHVGPLVLSHSTRSAQIDQRPLKLTPHQFGLLSVLALNPGQPVSREVLDLLARKPERRYNRVVDVQMYQI